MLGIYFISPQTVKDYSVLDNNVDDKMINVAITAAQETMLQPLIGTNLYSRLEQIVIGEETNQDYLNLMANQVRNYLIAATVLKVSVNLLYRYANTGVLKDSNANSASIGVPELNAIRQEKEAEVKYYAQTLTDYLLVNQSTFPEYLSMRIGDVAPERDQSALNFFYDED